MNVIELKNGQGSLNKIESFIEEICDKFNIGDTFLGNLLIAISEVVNIVEKQNSDVSISFQKQSKKFLFEFSNFSKNFNLDYLNITNKKIGDVTSEIEDSLFMINALCDDLIIDKQKSKIVVAFLNTGVDEVISNHRKEYLSNFLNQRIKV